MEMIDNDKISLHSSFTVHDLLRARLTVVLHNCPQIDVKINQTKINSDRSMPFTTRETNIISLFKLFMKCILIYFILQF